MQWHGAWNLSRTAALKSSRSGYAERALLARLLAPAVLLLAWVAPAAAQTSSMPAPFPAVDRAATVHAVVTDGRTAYVGGSFQSAGPPSGPFALVSGADGSFVRNAPGAGQLGLSGQQRR